MQEASGKTLQTIGYSSDSESVPSTVHASRFVPDVGEVSIEDLIEDEEIFVSVSSNGFVKSVPSTSYKKQGRGIKRYIGSL